MQRQQFPSGSSTSRVSDSGVLGRQMRALSQAGSTAAETTALLGELGTANLDPRIPPFFGA